MALKAVALMGATGVGKSALALNLAEQLHTCIISCDSMQVYRGLDIGTAKPSGEEQIRVSHHLIDCVDLREVCSAASWAEQAAVIIAQENAAGRIPVVSGGTGLYLRTLLSGISKIPIENKEIREELKVLQKLKGTPYLHALLAEVDAQVASRLSPNDSQRVLRALSVYRSTGVPLSEWQTQNKQQQADIDCPVFVLEVPREKLRENLKERFHAMLEAGWLQEVYWLLEQGLDDAHPAMRAVGYRQLIAHLRGQCTLDQAISNGITATRRYAKRQQTWFRHQTEAVFGDTVSVREQIVEALQSCRN
ncbi:MAG: tRNA (adenosine(37)-N6)-dimethylallyltransferase MiaA [Mariprofundaceae bacterium]